MKLVLPTLIVLFFNALTISSFASIPSSRMILQRVSENSGTGAYTVEQQVELSSGSESIELKEIWTIQDESNMRLTVLGQQDMKDQIHFQFVYNGNNRWELNDGKREAHAASKEIPERLFFHRSPESLATALIKFQILPEGAIAKKMAGSKGSDFNYVPEKQVRLSRYGGVVNYAFGIPSEPESNQRKPGLWIEQDQFVIRKIIFPSQAELTTDLNTNYARGLIFPKSRTLSFGSGSASFKTLSIVAKSQVNHLMLPTSVDQKMKWDGLEKHPLKKLVTEFYERFR